MKNIMMMINNLQKCNFCKLNGFFSCTHNGVSACTCPCCGKFDFLNDDTCINDTSKYNFLFELEFDENDIRVNFMYCSSCKIIFELGCVHNNGGCEECVFNCHFIKKWKHKITNIEYEGMPQFDDENDWFNNVSNIEILQMHCPHNNNYCNNSYYAETNNKCELCSS